MMQFAFASTLRCEGGVDVLTDGEQRRDNYASFVGGLLDNCQLIPLSDLTAMVDDAEKFQGELRALDVPAGEVRHPVVYGKLGRSRSLAVHEFEYARACTDRPVKVALPGPYLLTRTMWLDCLTERPYETRDELGEGCRPGAAGGGAFPLGIGSGAGAVRRARADRGCSRQSTAMGAPSCAAL